MLTAERAATAVAGPSPATSPRLSIATVCLSGTLEDKLIAAAAAGFNGVEIVEADLLAAPRSPREVRQRCADLASRSTFTSRSTTSRPGPPKADETATEGFSQAA